MPQVDTQLLQQWQRLGKSLGQETLAWQHEGLRLLRNWKRWPRAYHTTAHLSACLEHLEQIQRQQPATLSNPAAVALALWFHDAVYWPWSRHNEDCSAAWAIRFLQSCDLNSVLTAQVQRHIMATQKHNPCATGDTQWVLDIDLAILGGSPHQYRTFECNIRKEYAFAPKKRYIEGRLAVLRSFATRSSIYLTPYFLEHYENNARTNIHHAMACLQAGRLIAP